jgi:hypothetical protein
MVDFPGQSLAAQNAEVILMVLLARAYPVFPHGVSPWARCQEESSVLQSILRFRQENIKSARGLQRLHWPDVGWYKTEGGPE